MNLSGSIALVTGANRGLGRHFASQLLERGAAKVYATARDARSIGLPGVEPLALDVTDPASVAAAARAAHDVTLVINNAGVSTGQNLVTGDLEIMATVVEPALLGVARALTGASGGDDRAVDGTQAS